MKILALLLTLLTLSSCALGSRNGYNSYIDYIDETVNTAIVPTASVSSISEIVGGSYDTCALYANNNVSCWGNDFSGNNSPVSAIMYSPLSGRGITKLFMRSSNVSLRGCGINSSGQIYCWNGSSNDAGTLIQ